MITDLSPSSAPTAMLSPRFASLLRQATQRIATADDHLPMMIIGDTNSGKSMLMMNIYEVVNPNGTINMIAFTHDDFARAQSAAARAPHPRFVGFDEADLSSVEWMSKWNNAVLKLLMKVRKSRIVWVFCNPSLNTIDKRFIREEMIKLLIVMRDKKKTYRTFYVYRKKELLQFMEKEKDPRLTLSRLTSRETAHKYAYMLAWAREYKGHLRGAYDQLKETRVVDLHDQFLEEVVKKKTIQDISKDSGVSHITVKKYLDKLMQDGTLPSSVKTPSGRYAISDEQVERIMEEMASNH